MPAKKDGAGKHWVEMEFVAPGTPEQIWQAMATGPGNSAWFTQAHIEERVGGKIEFQFGSMGGSSGEVTAWEPPRTLGYVEREWMRGAPPVATEITITSRSGDQCVVRMVHSLFATTDEWDDQLDGFESGWPMFFEVLRLYLTHFAGQPAACLLIDAIRPGGDLELWKQLTGALELAAANVGEAWEAPAGAPPLAGVVERVQQNFRFRSLLLRVDRPYPGVVALGTHVMGDAARAMISLYLYGPEGVAAAGAVKDQWSQWLNKQLGPTTPPLTKGG